VNILSSNKSRHAFLLAIWDITKYDKNSEKDYAQLLEECFRSIRSIIPPQTIVIWLTAVQI
jgi:hypothetical protein